MNGRPIGQDLPVPYAKYRRHFAAYLIFCVLDVFIYLLLYCIVVST